MYHAARVSAYFSDVVVNLGAAVVVVAHARAVIVLESSKGAEPVGTGSVARVAASVSLDLLGQMDQ